LRFSRGSNRGQNPKKETKPKKRKNQVGKTLAKGLKTERGGKKNCRRFSSAEGTTIEEMVKTLGKRRVWGKDGNPEEGGTERQMGGQKDGETCMLLCQKKGEKKVAMGLGEEKDELLGP